jgi:type IV secretory pathway VirB3-like protein
MRRSSPFHRSLLRPKLVLGVEKVTFLVLAFILCFAFVARAYWFFPIGIGFYFWARMQSKKDPMFLRLRISYFNEPHVYEPMAWAETYQSRPKGWGKKLPC